MKIVKPSWISSKEPLFTCDVHPDGSKFATGGQGESNGKITIWYLAPVQHADHASGAREAATLEHHEGCVNCVRWSHDGRYLASASDDKVVMIWTEIRYEVSAADTSYKCSYVLRGHNGDVLDVAWSPSDRYLASTSIDNTVIVWNCSDFPEKITTIKGHHGMVKGVVWDPIGRYLATQSTDKTLRIWRTEDWGEEKTIKGPFNKCGGTTTVLRLGWSPDGQYIVSSHAMNNDGPVAKIIERDNWKARMDFVGHRRAIESVRFNPKLFFYGKNPVSCVAIAGRDSSISVWLTSLKRPLFVLHDVFTSSILDISWTPDGYGLVVCSLDGSLAYLELTSKELGKPLSFLQVATLKKSTYGDMRQTNTTIIENPDFVDTNNESSSPDESMDTEEDTFPPPTPTSNGHHSPQDPSSKPCPVPAVQAPKPFSSSSNKPTSDIKDRQVESQTKDGRRRIMPVTLKAIEQPPAVPLSTSVAAPQPPRKRLQLTSVTTAPKPGISDPPLTNNNTSSTMNMMQVPAKLSKRLKLTAPVSNVTNNSEEDEHLDRLFAVISGTRFEVDNEKLWVRISRGDSSWTSALYSRVSCLASDQSSLVLCCRDGSLHVMDSLGNHLLPIINIGSGILKCAIAEHFAAVVTDVPSVYVWDVKGRRCKLKNESLASFITSRRVITQLQINKEGAVVVEFNDLTSCYYDYCLASWMILGRAGDVDDLWFKELGRNTKQDTKLAVLHKMIQSENGASRGAPDCTQTLRTVLLMEQQILICRHLNSVEEGRRWLMSLLRFLVSKSEEDRLRRFLQSVITNINDKMFGISGTEVIKDALKLISTNINLQRVYVEFKQQIEWLENRK